MRVVISTSSFGAANFVGRDALDRAGITVVDNPHRTRLTEDQISALLGTDAVGLVAGLEPLTRRVLEAATALRVVARVGTGTDSVDLVAARERGIRVLTTPDAPTQAVAELTLAHILGLLRHVAATDRDIRAGTWQGRMGGLLAGRCVGIVGLGRIGRRVAELVQAVGARVVGHDPHAAPPGIPTASLDDLCARADVLTLHVPYSREAHHLIDARRIACMPRGALLVNCARGGLVDEEALRAALEDGRLGGAALDCFEVEPYAGPLAGLANVQMTAHMGSHARETRDAMEREASGALVAALREIGVVS